MWQPGGSTSLAARQCSSLNATPWCPSSQVLLSLSGWRECFVILVPRHLMPILEPLSRYLPSPIASQLEGGAQDMRTMRRHKVGKSAWKLWCWEFQNQYKTQIMWNLRTKCTPDDYSHIQLHWLTTLVLHRRGRPISITQKASVVNHLSDIDLKWGRQPCSDLDLSRDVFWIFFSFRSWIKEVRGEWDEG